MKKKILIFMENLNGGGAERTVINIINHIDKNKYDIVLAIATDERNDYLHMVNPAAKIELLSSTSYFDGMRKLVKLIKKENPNLLFSTLNFTNIFLGIAKILSFKNIPLIVREANHRTAAGNVSKKNKLITNIIYNHFSTKVISLSEGVKKDLVDNFKVNKNKIVIIYNPIDLENINALKEYRPADMVREGNEKILLSVGKLAEQKDYPTLFKALKIVNDKREVKLFVLGRGPDEEKLKKLRKKLGLEKNIEFLGFKENPYAYMSAADLFVLTSKWEGFGHVIVEAMTVGTPVVATDCKSGPKEIIGHNEYGRIVEVGNEEKIAEEILHLLNDDDKMEKYSELGRKRAKYFNVESIVQEYAKVFLNEMRP